MEKIVPFLYLRLLQHTYIRKKFCFSVRQKLQKLIRAQIAIKDEEKERKRETGIYIYIYIRITKTNRSVCCCLCTNDARFLELKLPPELFHQQQEREARKLEMFEE